MNFWQIYSKPYLRVKHFVPHQQLAKRVLELLEIENQKIYLDAGCGPGFLVQNRKNIIGIDISEAMLEHARATNPDCFFASVDLNRTLPFPDQSFDGVYSNNVLAYLDQPNLVFQEFGRVLKPEGRLIVSTLRRSFNPFSLLREHFKTGQRISNLKSFLMMVYTILLNLRIMFKLWLGQYHGFEIEDLKKTASATGFNVLLGELAYANQNVLIVATKI
jgi:SAM-dependent methyltransferase